MRGNEQVYFNYPGNNEVKVRVANRNASVCLAEVTENGYIVEIDGENYCVNDVEAINIVVYDNTFRILVDSISLKTDEYGDLIITR